MICVTVRSRHLLLSCVQSAPTCNYISVIRPSQQMSKEHKLSLRSPPTKCSQTQDNGARMLAHQANASSNMLRLFTTTTMDNPLSIDHGLDAARVTVLASLLPIQRQNASATKFLHESTAASCNSHPHQYQTRRPLVAYIPRHKHTYHRPICHKHLGHTYD